MIVTRTIGLGRKAFVARAAFRTPTQRLITSSYRAVQVESVSPSSQAILNSQRLRRPSSPHFTIYQPQLTWLLSIVHRVAGVGLSVGLYGFLLGYLAAPVLGIPFDSTHIIEYVHGVPDWVKYTGKAIVAFPFTFHSLNGLRHLSWDLGAFLSVRSVYRTGYTVIAASIASGIALLLS
ncbi:uncharacterized protein EI90DRAFT_3036764 [Cantharellus anzutake]|uniref:uncharacterized protein n=1 Tax=Cantharellus anzutake TaxID=1750568 RepID=UPI0019083C04|nr:uncharacterized protein EI90DRAFT_3091856 [Cantharellus anzutake]XP_038922122.1 uncharacterized protein EI90DRAFT_3036764 [Cantharellus anzutake]KAF8313502.1 hypothetical protein EI90DRAFT_3091856 [Cantharellus anzutake]KAF8340760.1 hypothetical protein EI90DRAFT_3036764 [Cantharellus anzutake]